MIEALLIFVVLPLVLLFIGYLIWQSAMDSYGYNIFSIWVFVRLLIAIVCCFFDLYLGIVLFVLFSIWNFIATWRNTSILIAILAVIFQPIALLFAFSALNRLTKALND